jgi:LmbE family N-acetylglucosaminyl deacetylase
MGKIDLLTTHNTHQSAMTDAICVPYAYDRHFDHTRASGAATAAERRPGNTATTHFGSPDRPTGADLNGPTIMEPKPRNPTTPDTLGPTLWAYRSVFDPLSQGDVPRLSPLHLPWAFLRPSRWD